mmetsp:Transcript_16376/g.33216  ORF Transcript_16376/g.33216 Transcript_16376/m.33216 type:complete len:231 (+) Transcript_16376:580-1272(+)
MTLDGSAWVHLPRVSTLPARFAHGGTVILTRMLVTLDRVWVETVAAAEETFGTCPLTFSTTQNALVLDPTQFSTVTDTLWSPVVRRSWDIDNSVPLAAPTRLTRPEDEELVLQETATLRPPELPMVAERSAEPQEPMSPGPTRETEIGTTLSGASRGTSALLAKPGSPDAVRTAPDNTVTFSPTVMVGPFPKNTDIVLGFFHPHWGLDPSFATVSAAKSDEQPVAGCAVS